MVLGCVTALAFMVKDGIDANTPIYYSLAIGLVSYVAVSLFSQQPAIAGSGAPAESQS